MNSSLVSYIKLSPNHSGKRKHLVDTITPHCFVGQVTVERIGKEFESAAKNASCNYGIAKDGKIALIVNEENRSWCSSNEANDQRAITIECASDSKAPYAFNDEVMATLRVLVCDIMKRYGKSKLVYFSDKASRVNYEPKKDEMKITLHRDFSRKSCPGDWFVSKLPEFVDSVNKCMEGSKPKEDIQKPKAEYTYPKPGEGLYAIARRCNVSVSDLKKLNPQIKAPMYLVPFGKQVRIR